MTNSVNTNTGALVAVSTLRTKTTDLNRTSRQIETGYRVNDASDDAAVFAVAQGVRGTIKAYASVQSSLSAGIGLGEVTESALTGISNLIGDIKAKLAALSDGSLTTAQQDVYRSDTVKYIEQINNYIGQATFNGKNLLKGDALTPSGSGPLSFVADVAGTTLSYQTAHRLDWDSDNMLGPNVIFPSATDVYENIYKNPPDITTAKIGLSGFEARLQEMVDEVTPTMRAMQQQKAFVDNMVDAMKTGLGALVDADVAAQSAALQSGQVAEQLASQSLSIANQQPNVLLQLLR